MNNKISSKKLDPQNIDVLILSGGQGTRLREVVKDRPKPMAEIHNRPFLDLLIDYVASFGFKRFLLSTGYLSEYIENYYRQNKKKDLEIIISKETKPLGTGGALKHAQKLIKSNHFLVLNGDSFCQVDFAKFLKFHFQKKSLLSLIVVKDRNRKDGGNIILNSNNKINRFNEKTNHLTKNKYLNAGIYLFNKKIFSLLPAKTKFSLEYDLFPKLIGKELYGYPLRKKLIDIGTPARYLKAKKDLKNNFF